MEVTEEIVTCLSIDNENSKGVHIVGQSGFLEISGEPRFYFEGLRSSTIKHIERTGDLITIHTRNSIYVFQKYITKDN
jgi:hypothetical protein